MKKRLVVILSLIIAVVFIGGSAAMASSASPISWPTNLMHAALYEADLVIEGTVIGSRPLDTDVRRAGANEKNFAFYDVSVDDVWFGEYSGDTIRLLIRDGVTQPRKGDEAVFLLRFLYNTEDVCLLTRVENSVFIKNPPYNLLFAMSPASDCTAYDGQFPRLLKMHMKEALEQLGETGENIKYASGDIAKPYREEYYKEHPGER